MRALARPPLSAPEPLPPPAQHAHSLLASIRFSSLSDFTALDPAPRADEQPPAAPHSAFCHTPSTNSSGRITPAAPLPSADTSADSNTLKNEHKPPTAAASLTAAVRARIGEMFPDFAMLDNDVQSPEELSNAAAEDKLSRFAHLADAFVLFSNFSVRGIVVLITALLEERHVCIVGPSSSLVSRAVLALKDLLRPFEWPHILSPILPSRHLHVLGAPIPYLVGILDEFYPEALELPLVDELVFAHMQSGKVVSHPEPQDISKHIPRRLRNRLERRLTRIKSACTRNRLRLNLSENSLSTIKSAVSGGGDQFDDDGHAFESPLSRPTTLLQEDYPSKFQTSTMWRSRSHNKLNKLSNPGPSSLDTFISTEALTALDKAMCKFFAELLADLPSVEGAGVDQGAPVDATPTILPTVATSILSPPSISRKESRTLLRSFVHTQMYMQWESDEQRDPTFGIVQSDNARRRRRRAAEARERSLLQARGAVDDVTDVEEDMAPFVPSVGARNALLLPRFKRTRAVSEFLEDDGEDAGVLSGPETVSQRRAHPFSNMRKLRRQRDEVVDEETCAFVWQQSDVREAALADGRGERGAVPGRGPRRDVRAGATCAAKEQARKRRASDGQVSKAAQQGAVARELCG
ncbi:cDENN [Gracilaria domingensis]|nr:cDENN [Gracilaria domingensis]